MHQPVGAAVLSVSSHVEPAARGAFDEWCNTIHHFDTMRIDGFLALRRFERVETVGPPSPFDLLTLYQVNEPGDADFSTPAYLRHTATYTPPPAVVDGSVSYERTVYRRAVAWPEPLQPIGDALLTVRASTAEGLAALALIHAAAADVDGVVSTYVVVNADPSVAHDAALIVEVDDVAAGHRALTELGELVMSTPGVQATLFRQVFPERGALLRDRALSASSG